MTLPTPASQPGVRRILENGKANRQDHQAQQTPKQSVALEHDIL